MREIELKFAVEPASRPGLAASPLLAGTPRRRRMASVYFDCDDGALQKGRMALRLRREGRRWVQTLKTAGSGAGGLHARDEWEFERPRAELDLSLFRDTPLASLRDAATLHERLHPVFEVNFLRTSWDLAPAPGCRLEVALDTGTVSRGERSEAISELEIECLEGDPSCAFELAAKLMDAAALRPSAVTKAQRGYRLFAGGRLEPVKALAPRLDPAMTPLVAARAVLRAGLEQLQANEEGVLATRDPEFVHQARVALRRMRSALRMFRDVIGRDRAEQLRGGLAETGAALGQARDWDVFAAETLPAATRAFGDAGLVRSMRSRAARERARRLQAAREALRSARHAHAILELARFLTGDAPGAAASAGPLDEFAARLVRKRHRRVMQAVRRLPAMTREERHRVRIDAKRLRYGADSLASLFKSAPVKRYLAAVAHLQETLGTVNDAATALELLPRLPAPAGFGAFARGWFTARAEGEAAAFEACAAMLAAAPHFWKKRQASPTP